MYKELGTNIARSATIGEGTVLGRDAVVDDHVQLHRICIGARMQSRQGVSHYRISSVGRGSGGGWLQYYPSNTLRECIN